MIRPIWHNIVWCNIIWRNDVVPRNAGKLGTKSWNRFKLVRTSYLIPGPSFCFFYMSPKMFLKTWLAICSNFVSSKQISCGPYFLKSGLKIFLTFKAILLFCVFDSVWFSSVGDFFEQSWLLDLQLIFAVSICCHFIGRKMGKNSSKRF